MKCASERERENVAGNQREYGITVRIISNDSSHRNIFVGAVTFRNIGKWGPVNPKLVSDMAEARPQDSRRQKTYVLHKLKSKAKPSEGRRG